MKIYIPPNLKKLEIISKLEKMILAYSDPKDGYYEEDQSSFSDYYYSLKNDPVHKFLSMRITQSGDEKELENNITYISRLFYSVKGTNKVFDYMKKYLNLNIEGDIIYTTEYIEFSISGIELTDEGGFSEALINFLNALLYFKELRLKIPTINLKIEKRFVNYCNSEIITYRKQVSKPIEDQYI